MAKRAPRANASASIQDVADAASVSIATVSRVLNNPDLVSRDTFDRVHEAITRLRYRPNVYARGLINGTRRVLGFALPDLHGEFYSELLRGADGEANRLGFHLLVTSEGRSQPALPPAPGQGPGTDPTNTPTRPGERTSGFEFGLVGGVAVMITEPNAALLQESIDLALPVVVIDLEIKHPRVDCILIDNAQGATLATEHLLQTIPPERLSFAGGPRDNFDTKTRADAFVAALRARGGEPRPDQLTFGAYSVEWGQRWISEHASRQAGGLPFGVLAGNDEIALGILQAAQDLGLRVPQDVRIVGFDDTRLASLVRPSLSSVRVPLRDVGAEAIRLLARRIAEPDAAEVVTRLPASLIVRESSR
ncbi:MAG: LacI family DNA-binding transcriptional regulator [Planctomycetota bacterium]|nr:LacI family DNA-binding transcriptional regulator [Planctomycetota bacterium]